MLMRFRTNTGKAFDVDIQNLRKGTIKINAVKDDKPFSYTFPFDLSRTNKYNNMLENGLVNNEFIIPYVEPETKLCSYEVNKYGDTSASLCGDIVLFNSDNGSRVSDGYIPPIATGYFDAPINGYDKIYGTAQSHTSDWRPGQAQSFQTSNDMWNFIYDDRVGLYYTFNLHGQDDTGNQWPIIYQSKNLVDWFEISDYPLKGDNLIKAGKVTGISGRVNVWSGSVFFDTDNRFGFGNNKFIWFVSLPATGGYNFFGQNKPGNIDALGWCVSNEITEMPYDGGVLYQSPDVGNFRDPRYMIDDNNKFVVAAPGCPGKYNTAGNFWGSNYQTYFVFELNKLIPGSNAQVSNFRSLLEDNPPEDRLYNAREVAGPSIMTDKSTGKRQGVFWSSAQTFEKSTWNSMPPARWNSLLNTNVFGFTNYTANSYNEQRDEHIVDLGLDIYAVGPTTFEGEQYYMTGFLNWGITSEYGVLGYNPMGTSSPLYKCELVNGFMRFSFIKGLPYETQPVGSDIRLVKSDGSTLTRLYNRNNRLVLDWNGTVMNEFAWKTDRYDWSRINVLYNHYDKAYMQYPVYDQVKEVQYYIDHKRLFMIVKFINDHDRLFTACCKSDFKVNGIDGVKTYTASSDRYKPNPAVSYYWKQNTLYRKQGDLNGDGGNVIPPQPVKGWARQGDEYYLDGTKVNPNDYLHPKGDTPAYSIAVGSDYYASKFAVNRDFIPGGVNLTKPDYVIPTKFGYGQGNDIISYVEGIDGKKYTMQLTNLTYTDYKTWNADRNAPVLFYQDVGSNEWCQYIVPFDPMRNPNLKGVGRIWSGSFYIFKRDTTLSGYNFKKGNVFYIFYNPPYQQSGTHSIFGVNTPADKNCIMWGIADTIDKEVTKGGVACSFVRGSGGDPRMWFEGGKIHFAVNGNGDSTEDFAFSRYQINTLKENAISDTSQFGILYGNQMPEPAKGHNNFECPAPMVVGGKKLFGYCSQLVDVGGVWNTPVNQNWIWNCDSNWKTVGSPRLYDIGYDSYAISGNNKDLMNPETNEGYINTTAFNWAAIQDTFKGKPQYEYISGSYPWKKFKITGDWIDYDTEGWNTITFNGSTVNINRDGSKVTEIGFSNGGLQLAVVGAVKGEFFWNPPGYTMPAYNEPMPIKPSQITGVYYKVMNHFMTVMLKVSGDHDVLCSVYFVKDGTYSIS